MSPEYIAYLKLYEFNANSPSTSSVTEEIHFKEWYQYIVYNKLDMNRLLPFIEKYFTPSDIILDIQKYIEKKYENLLKLVNGLYDNYVCIGDRFGLCYFNNMMTNIR